MNPRYLLLSVAPSILSLLLYYSLAIHMYFSLGQWPKSIGESGFPGGLVVHANIQMFYFIVLMLLAICVLPVAALAFRCNVRLRAFSLYCLASSATFFLSFALMQIAPAQFLYWWWD